MTLEIMASTSVRSGLGAEALRSPGFADLFGMEVAHLFSCRLGSRIGDGRTPSLQGKGVRSFTCYLLLCFPFKLFKEFGEIL